MRAVNLQISEGEFTAHRRYGKIIEKGVKGVVAVTSGEVPEPLRETVIKKVAASKSTKSSSEFDIGIALRAAYASTLQESIPAEMLDLLNKLR